MNVKDAPMKIILLKNVKNPNFHSGILPGYKTKMMSLRNLPIQHDLDSTARILNWILQKKKTKTHCLYCAPLVIKTEFLIAKNFYFILWYIWLWGPSSVNRKLNFMCDNTTMTSTENYIKIFDVHYTFTHIVAKTLSEL